MAPSPPKESVPVSQPLVFLHLSDIHFSKRSSTAYDPDLDLRRELVADSVRTMDKVKVCSGILVSGDIAFSGKPDEYAKARDWLGELCKLLGCPEEAVWVIPGNHDVDRDVIKKSGIIQDKHRLLRQGDLENEIRRLHDDEEAFEALQRPLSGYVKFAGGYECLPKPKHLYWEDDIEFNDKSILRIRGCNSAFVSGEKDDENENRLVVGRNQMLPSNAPGVVNLLMCHHPLDWLHDRDALRDSLRARTRICLFGHKHVQRLERSDDTLFVMAGAVHPEKNEGKWEPRYNFLGLSVGNNGGHRHLAVDIWPRIWDDVQKVFKGDLDNNGADRRPYQLPLPPWQPPPPAEAEAPKRQRSGTEVTAEGKIVNPKRRLVYRFHSLPYVTRLEIVTKLKLVAEEDQDLKEEERQIRYFRRAEQNDILDQLWTAVEQQHGKDLSENPFAKKA
jgi:predicted phosphodiesterase